MCTARLDPSLPRAREAETLAPMLLIRSTMQSRLSFCLALALVVSAQVDDAWAIASLAPLASPAVDDDDEYLAPERQQDYEGQHSCQDRSLGNLNAVIGNSLSLCLGRGILSCEDLSRPFGPSSLYLFMSLQR
jgi:hypothetical protein